MWLVLLTVPEVVVLPQLFVPRVVESSFSPVEH